jgi:uncharacterized protein DUF4440
MSRWLPVVLLAALATPAIGQESVHTFKVVDVRWVDQVDARGNHTTVPHFIRSASDPDQSIPEGTISLAEQSRLLARDEQWRQAKLANDLPLMAEVLSDDFFETNQNGNSRNKAQMLDLWSTFRIASLTTGSATIRLSGEAATISGQQTEVNATGTDRMLFTRVYVKDKNGNWRLLSSTQFRDPQGR